MFKETKIENLIHHCGCSRRRFMAATGSLLAVRATTAFAAEVGISIEPFREKPIAQAGPASKYRSRIQVAFVRRKGDYGMRWPGAIYDGEAAFEKYRGLIQETAKQLGMDVEIRPEPIYSPEEADEWFAKLDEKKPDGLLLVLLDRQEHAWPTATKAVDHPIPAIIFAPIGAAFTTNTAPLAEKDGAFICSTDNFDQVRYGMKMIHAGARLRETRFVVLKGSERRDEEIPRIGTKIRYIPASDFAEIYHQTPTSSEIQGIADEYLKNATRVSGPTREDVLNGVKSFVVARTILEREEADGISMDCLGALGPTEISLPCIAWSRMLDHGIPAACEADIGACLTHALVQYLFDRPGFQQDPVPDTANDCLIGAHCTCPTRLGGFDKDPEPYHLSPHHGNRDAVPVPQWRSGQRATVTDLLLPKNSEGKPEMIIATGDVVGNIAVPPAGGCVVSVSLKMDGDPSLLAFPGFHQLFFYGDYKKELKAYCQLQGLDIQVV
ncbi:MAG: hypothetical protein H6752_05305 [Candidatus Omnitrophica bacterium]|nr:hypothetical protein [Candidatus Omnitrophota bacterium]